MSKREAMRKSRQEAAAQRQMIFIAVAVALAVLVVGYIIYLNSTPFTGEATAYAHGKSLGEPNAPVVIQEFSDFQ
jgi:hypothetical protein